MLYLAPVVPLANFLYKPATNSYDLHFEFECTSDGNPQVCLYEYQVLSTTNMIMVQL